MGRSIKQINITKIMSKKSLRLLALSAVSLFNQSDNPYSIPYREPNKPYKPSPNKKKPSNLPNQRPRDPGLQQEGCTKKIHHPKQKEITK